MGLQAASPPPPSSDEWSYNEDTGYFTATNQSGVAQLIGDTYVYSQVSSGRINTYYSYGDSGIWVPGGTKPNGTGLNLDTYLESNYADPIVNFAAVGIGAPLLGATFAPAMSEGLVGIGSPLSQGFSWATFAVNDSDRVVAGLTDFTMQSMFNPATGSDYNYASTLAAVWMPERYFVSGFLGGGLTISNSVPFDFEPDKAILGGIFGLAGGKTTKYFDNNTPSMPVIYRHFPSLFFKGPETVINNGN